MTVWWILILISVTAACAAGAAYLTAKIGKFGGIRRIAGEKKWRRRLIAFGSHFIIFVVLALIFNVVNAVIIFLHVVILFLLTGLVMRIIKRIRGKETRIFWQGWSAIAVAAIYLSIAYVLCTTVVQKDYSLTTDKQIEPMKIAMFADSHIGSTFDGEGLGRYTQEIMAQNPDLVVVAGDFVDDSTSREDMITACKALGEMHPRYGVWFAYGNHDKGYYGPDHRGYTPEELQQELEKNQVHVLSDEVENIGDDLCIVGRKDKHVDRDRQELSELMKNVDENRYVIVIDHEPNDYEKEAETGADLVLSGHTHGGQLFPVNYIGEWLCINDKTYGYENRNGTDFIVTSGISDWEMVFKTGTRSEWVMINVNNNK